MFPSLTPVERRVLTSLCSEIDGPAAVNGGLGAFRRNKVSILRTAPGSLLWRPDDYHRDLRARLHTAISPDPSNPDRQLMIAIAGSRRPNADHSCRLCSIAASSFAEDQSCAPDHTPDGNRDWFNAPACPATAI